MMLGRFECRVSVRQWGLPSARSDTTALLEVLGCLYFMAEETGLEKSRPLAQGRLGSQ